MVRPNPLGWAAGLWDGEAELPSRPEDSLLLVTILPGSSAGKESARNAGDLGSIPGLGRSPGEGIAYSLPYFWASLVAQLVKNLPAMREM